MSTFSSYAYSWINKYKVHLLIFLSVFFIGITFAHPSLLLTDEWVTVNQLDQIHAGHQVVINEGKYGTFQNGTVSPYFTAKNNVLGYSLFLPLISIPAYCLLDMFGDFFVFFIICLWTLLLIVIGLLLNGFFRSYTFEGRWQWTTALICAAFVLLTLNFIYYLPFFATGDESFPEIMAIVFTNIFLFALLAVCIFEINLTIFQNTIFAAFGSCICIGSSSYLFWTTTCKDHILTIFIFTLVIMMLVKYQRTGTVWFLRSAFIATGILSWARPELALVVFGALFLYTGFTLINREGFAVNKTQISLLLSPLFTLIGSIPFFINNYMITGNPLLVPFTLWDKEPSINGGSAAIAVQQNISVSFQPLLNIINASTNFNSSTFLGDLYGIFLNPQSGSLGVLIVTPLFLAAVFLAPILVLKKELPFSSDEKMFLGIAGLFTLAVFFTYVRGIHGLNASPGILPDIRYLSPIYLPLNIISLIILQKFRIFSGNEIHTLWKIGLMGFFSALGSLILILLLYPFPDNMYAPIFTLLNGYTTIITLVLVAFFIISIIACKLYGASAAIPTFIFAILCSVPPVWQIDVSVVMRAFASGLGGYSFWIPVVRMFFATFFGLHV
jgi:hypothetical protein